jgi:hypothetical protein
MIHNLKQERKIDKKKNLQIYLYLPPHIIRLKLKLRISQI